MEDEIKELGKDMTPILLEDLGMKFPTEKSNYKARHGLYQCQYCGKEFETVIQNVKKGNTKSCGCQSDKFKNPHGLSKHLIYLTWRMMLTRCYKANAINYKDYGARGIQVCERWLDIENFIEDMYPSYEEGLTLDRIDVNGNYSPDNCRWVNSSIQAQNTRDIRTTNTSGFRGVTWNKNKGKWKSQINNKNEYKYLGYYQTALEAGKAYERYIRLNNLEHNFTPALTEEEIEELNKQKENKNDKH